jgi:chemotaxis protein methyltransferase CheR
MKFTDSVLKELLESIRLVYGYDFKDYAEASFKRRVAHFMSINRLESVETLAKLILKDEAFFEQFIQEMSVTVTEMFRDPLFYKCIRERLVKRLATYPFIKIWIAGCATGEEAYSMAILLQEENLLDRSLIYATDINQRSLKIAKEGIYSIAEVKKYTSNYIKSGGNNSFSQYYNAKFDAVLFDKGLKQKIIFSPHNLTADKSFNEFQLITCRNVLIYFNQPLQNEVINLFYESLCAFGFLGLGSKESLLFSDKKKCFDEMDKKEKLYIKMK